RQTSGKSDIVPRKYRPICEIVVCRLSKYCGAADDQYSRPETALKSSHHLLNQQLLCPLGKSDHFLLKVPVRASPSQDSSFAALISLPSFREIFNITNCDLNEKMGLPHRCSRPRNRGLLRLELAKNQTNLSHARPPH